ncbi:MAG: NADH-quinone oxidoreductase subunit G [Gammaproteobacteria bacterium]|nr:NADH-quinone oxidoreductase subunit G [Gammaproteobacteria bacterium]
MSAVVENTEKVSIEIDGQTVEVPKGASIIAVADELGIDIPRFCYHSKLSAPANCRMCLVDVEMGGRPVPKPLPACITTVADGMVVRTASERALKAQQGVMEFLLINHPLDCPICDQGGECELQDLALGYGRSVSRFVEGKRVVKDENLGPLIATEMTRCIHCTRCVRFLDEIAGTSELGAMHRGEHTEIGTLVGDGVHSELSGNIIDLCPVGALTSRPYRFTARAWEMTSHAGIAPHDCLGSNVELHQLRGRIKRVVPRDNEAVNECWISDRDRFSYEGAVSENRLLAPLLRDGDQWHEVDWQTALEAVANALRDTVDAHGAEAVGSLISPSATLEEMALHSALMRALGSDNIDTRLQRADFRDATSPQGFPGIETDFSELDNQDTVLLIGSYPRQEQPLLNHRLRKAALAGGHVLAINPCGFDWNFDLSQELIAHVAELPAVLAATARELARKKGLEEPAALSAWQTPSSVSADKIEQLAVVLASDGKKTVLSGALVEGHPAGAELRYLGALIAELSGAAYGALTPGANSAGAWLAGALPDRRPDGSAARGLNAQSMLTNPLKAYLLHGIEPEHDCHDPQLAAQAFAAAEHVIALSSWDTPALREQASILLPLAAFGETAGTFVNANGHWQIFGGVGQPLGEARPGWRVLRVLGNILGTPGFDYEAPDQIHAEVKTRAGDAAVARPSVEQAVAAQRASDGMQRVGMPALYGVDALSRHAPALQATDQAQPAVVLLNPSDAVAQGLTEGGKVSVTQGSASQTFAVHPDERVPAGSFWLAGGLSNTAGLGAMIGSATLVAAGTDA